MNYYLYVAYMKLAEYGDKQPVLHKPHIVTHQALQKLSCTKPTT